MTSTHITAIAPNPIEETVASCLTSVGFSGGSGNWQLETAETRLRLELQPSSYGKHYHIILAISFRALDRDLERASHEPFEWHVKVRADALRSAELRDEDRMALDLYREIDDQQRRRRIAAIVRESALPFLLRSATISGLRAVHAGGTLESAVLSRSVYALLA